MRDKMIVLSLLACVVLAACDSGPMREEVPPATSALPSAAEDLRLGVDQGPEELMFGHISDLAVGADGEIYIADEQAVVIRAFDRSGRYLGEIGNHGQGPGEYTRIDSIKVLPDGAVVVLDRPNGRVSNFRPGGDFDSSFQPVGGPGGRDSLQVDVAGNVYVLGRDPARSHWRASALFRYTNGAENGSVAVPLEEPIPDPGFVVLHPLGELEPFTIATRSAWNPLGFLVVGRNDEYRLEARSPGGPVFLERDVEAVALGAEERLQWEALADFIVVRGEALGFNVTRVVIPDTKPFFAGVFAASDGRVWIRRYVEAIRTPPAPHFGNPDRPPVTWVEAPAFDVFEPDGRFLGTVTLPMNTRPFVFGEAAIWGVQTNDAGVEQVVRLRLSGLR